MLKERDSLRHECDRLQCERDAMQLERDTLLREKEELQAELNNRNDIIHHLQDHVVSDLSIDCGRDRAGCGAGGDSRREGHGISKIARTEEGIPPISQYCVIFCNRNKTRRWEPLGSGNQK